MAMAPAFTKSGRWCYCLLVAMAATTGVGGGLPLPQIIRKRTLELDAIIETQGGTISEFSEELYSAIIEKIIVKERTSLVFYLKNGLAFEERYSLQRGHDIL